MAIMKLLWLPSEKELRIHEFEWESFYEAFLDNQIKRTFSAEVKVEKDGSVDLDGFNIPPSDWFEIIL